MKPQDTGEPSEALSLEQGECHIVDQTGPGSAKLAPAPAQGLKLLVRQLLQHAQLR